MEDDSLMHKITNISKKYNFGSLRSATNGQNILNPLKFEK